MRGQPLHCEADNRERPFRGRERPREVVAGVVGVGQLVPDALSGTPDPRRPLHNSLEAEPRMVTESGRG